MKAQPPTPEEIKALFEEYKLSYTQVAKLSGIGRATAERWANGRTRMPYLSFIGLKHMLKDNKI